MLFTYSVNIFPWERAENSFSLWVEVLSRQDIKIKQESDITFISVTCEAETDMII